MRLSSAGQDEDNVEEEQPLASVDIDSAELENITEDLMKMRQTVFVIGKL